MSLAMLLASDVDSNLSTAKLIKKQKYAGFAWLLDRSSGAALIDVLVHEPPGSCSSTPNGHTRAERRLKELHPPERLSMLVRHRTGNAMQRLFVSVASIAWGHELRHSRCKRCLVMT